MIAVFYTLSISSGLLYDLLYFIIPKNRFWLSAINIQNVEMACRLKPELAIILSYTTASRQEKRSLNHIIFISTFA